MQHKEGNQPLTQKTNANGDSVNQSPAFPTTTDGTGWALGVASRPASTSQSQHVLPQIPSYPLPQSPG